MSLPDEDISEQLRASLLQEYAHVLAMEVRDYECDVQGIVNNSVYQNYLEHARHKFLLQEGVDFLQLAQQGINLVVVRIEIDYKTPLRPGDNFVIASKVKRQSRLRFIFEQDIFILQSEKPVIQAKVTGAAMDNNGRPVRYQGLDFLFQ